MKSLEKVFAGTVIVSSLLFGGVSKLTMADVIAVSSHPGVVRIYNPQEFSQSGTVRVTPLGQVPSSNDVVIPYDLPAHNVKEFAVEAGLVRVTPDGTSPNPVVDFETNPDGGIASPALFTDLTTKHTTGNGTGNALIISKDGGPVVVSQYANGKPSSATTLATTSGTAFSTPVNGTFSVDFLNGSGAVAFENGEQRAINASQSLLSTTAYWWAKPSTVVLKPTRLEMEEIIAADSALFAAFVAKANVDPDTLMPATYLWAVSVVTEDSGLADALSTALFTLSVEEGQALLQRFPGVEALWVNLDGTLVRSAGFSALTAEEITAP